MYATAVLAAVLGSTTESDQCLHDLLIFVSVFGCFKYMYVLITKYLYMFISVVYHNISSA